jgi:ankyrin repeat protein
LEQYRKQAKDLVKLFKISGQRLIPLLREHHPRFRTLTDAEVLSNRLALTDAQLILARQHGFESWPKFSRHIESVNRERSALLKADPVAAFIEAACVPQNDWHGSGTIENAEAILARHPEVARASVYTAAILGDEEGVRHFLAIDANSAGAKGGFHNWDALTYLCFSKYLRLDRNRSDGFVGAARVLLDAGASANTGWYDNSGQPQPFYESAIYGAAGLAQHPGLTRLLLEHGADPNDEETPYHVPETYNNAVMEILVESGKLNNESLTTLLLRKTDWHDYKGIKYLLEHGAQPSRMTHWQNNAFHHALRRDNNLAIIDLLLDHGADPALKSPRDNRSAIAIAARKGRGDVLRSLERRGIPIELQGADVLIAACAKNDAEAIRTICEREPAVVRELQAQGGTLLAEFAGNGNNEGVRQLLDLGVDVAAPYTEGDAYFEIEKDSTALHVAAWRARHATVALLIECGAPVDTQDRRGRTPLAFAIRACVDSYWKDMRSPESVEMLLRAGASVRGIDYPCGYAEVDDLLRQYRKHEGT